MSSPGYATNTRCLRKLIVRAEEQNFNRQIELDVFDEFANPDGFHILMVVLPFHNDQDHHRCYVMMSVKGREEPEIAYLDVQVDDLEKYTTREMNPEAIQAVSDE